MLTHQKVKEIMSNHKQKIQLVQWATMGGVSSLIYTLTVSNSVQRHTPTRTISIPSGKTIEADLSLDGEFITHISETLIDNILDDNMFIKFSNAPEFSPLFTDDDSLEILRTIFDLYIIPNVSKYIPQAITNKFGLNNPHRQLFKEDNEIPLLGDNIPDGYYDYVAHETLLQLLLLIPSMKKSIVLPENNNILEMSNNDILTIGTNDAVSLTLFDNAIFNMKILNELCYVTSTRFIVLSDHMKDDVIHFTTAPFNEVSLTKLEGISEANP